MAFCIPVPNSQSLAKRLQGWDSCCDWLRVMSFPANHSPALSLSPQGLLGATWFSLQPAGQFGYHVS